MILSDREAALLHHLQAQPPLQGAKREPNRSRRTLLILRSTGFNWKRAARSSTSPAATSLRCRQRQSSHNSFSEDDSSARTSYSNAHATTTADPAQVLWLRQQTG